MTLMTLDQYIRKNGLTSARFAAEAGINSKQTVHNYRHNLRFPSKVNLIRILNATHGQVTPEDFLRVDADLRREFA